MKNTTKIYGLVSTRDLTNVRYIGKTMNPLYQRRYGHQKEALSYKYNTWKCRWIRKEIKAGFKLKIILIDEVYNQDWEFWEIYYIIEYKRRGYKITNATPGGDANYNPGNARSITVLKRSGGFVIEYPSIAETSRQLNISLKQIECCLYKSNKLKSSKGYQFIYSEEYDSSKSYNIIKIPKTIQKVPKEQRLASWKKNSDKARMVNMKSIAAYDIEGKLFKVWVGRKAAAEDVNGKIKGIDKALSGEKPRYRYMYWRIITSPHIPGTIEV